MNERRIYLDNAPGEVRGVVTLDDQPERLIVRRNDDDERLLLGTRLVARVANVEPAFATAFLSLGPGAEAILPFKPIDRPVQGQALEVEIRAEPRSGKLAVARALGEAEGEPRLVAPPPDVGGLLRSLAPRAALVEGRVAREVADEAEVEALESLHRLPGGGVLAIEPTRALVAVDVDLADRKGSDTKRVARQANLAALAAAARLLRLKSLGGLVVIDLVGRGHDGPALMAAARSAFAPDNPGVAIGPVGRFGTIELSLPRRTRPVAEMLLCEGGAPSDRTLAHRLVRRMEAEAAAQPGRRLTATCTPAVAQAAEPLVALLTERFGRRFAITSNAALKRDQLEVCAI